MIRYPDEESIAGLRMERQFLTRRATEAEYTALYRDTQPGQNVYWCGFGDPPSMTFRAAFDDIAFNRRRQEERLLVKGRFQGGTLGWIEAEDLELFACLFRKESGKPRPEDLLLLDLIGREGPMNIQQMKELTGLLVKEITPALHRLQEQFLIYEDQYDGAWDREWYRFAEMFPEVDLRRYSRQEALKIILKRYANRIVFFDAGMAKSFYRLPVNEITSALEALEAEDVLVPYEAGYLRKEDLVFLQTHRFRAPASVFAMHRNDFLVKSYEPVLKETYRHPQYDILQYLLIDGTFRGAVYGHFKNGPYVVEDVVPDLPEDERARRKPEILEAVYAVNSREHSPVRRYCGSAL